VAVAPTTLVRAQATRSPNVKVSTKHKVAVAAGIGGGLLIAAFIASSIGGWGVGKALDVAWDKWTKKKR
jgi:hypothetical protein